MALKTDEDLFTESTMTFGEHLEELRVCLFRAIIGLVIGTVIGLYFGDSIVKAIERPLKVALRSYYTTIADKEYTDWAYARYDAKQPVPYKLSELHHIARGDPYRDDDDLVFEMEQIHAETFAGTMGLTRNGPPTPAPQPTATAPTSEPPPKPEDARKWAVEGKEVDGKMEPSRFERTGLVMQLLWHPVSSDTRFSLQATGTSEAFTVWLKAAIVLGIVLSSPWVFYQLWTFVAAGLYPHERKYVYLYLPFSLGLFLAGASMAYLFVFEPVLNFLFEFNKSMKIDPDPKINEWLGFVLILPLGFGISFQLPLVMLFLSRIGIFTLDDYISKWRISVLMIFIISAVLTPADPYSIFFMAIPLTVLYFGGLVLVKYMPQHTPAVRRI